MENLFYDRSVSRIFDLKVSCWSKDDKLDLRLCLIAVLFFFLCFYQRALCGVAM